MTCPSKQLGSNHYISELLKKVYSLLGSLTVNLTHKVYCYSNNCCYMLGLQLLVKALEIFVVKVLGYLCIMAMS